MKGIATLPVVRIKIGGSYLEDRDVKFLSAIRVIRKLSLPSLCELVFVDPDHVFADAFGQVSGAELTVVVQGGSSPLFQGLVTAVEYSYEPSGGLTIRIRGYDALYRLCKRQQISTHFHTTVPEMMKRMVSEYGLKVEANVSVPRWEKLVQYKQTDLDFLAHTAQRCGLYFILWDNIVHIVTLEGFGDEIPLEMGKNLFETTIEINDAPALQSVYSCGWDPFTAEMYAGKASEARSGCDISANISGELAIWQKERKLMDVAVRSKAEAEALAQAELDRCKALEKNISGVAEGDPDLLPGRIIHVEGVSTPLQGRYVLTEVEHIMNSKSGFISRFSTSPPPLLNEEAATSVTFGVVTDIHDPKKLGRVKVLLPTCDNNETDWMNVLLPAAGQGKGLVMLPDKGDQVLVVFLNNDLARGVVLGGIYGASKHPPDWGIKGGKVQRYNVMTPGGQHIMLDDHTQAVRVENKHGSYVELTPKKVRLHSEADIEIEAPGKNVTIRGSRVDFKKG